ncbi:MAG: hypothetical protein U9R38_02695 [Candidatus Margulisiibacteriota bacterium]|nr:hypothetical protein [Candidatus Margulisiibacteriota bacterium]
MFFAEHTVGGAASRLRDSARKVKFGEKFFITPKELAFEIEAKGFGKLLGLSLGERHMLQKAFWIHNLAKEMGGEHWTNVLARQKMLIIPNEKSEARTLETFRKFDFFGFKPENVMFLSSKFYPGLVLENGILRPDPKNSYLHNHGIVSMQVCMEDTIFTVDPDTGNKISVSKRQYKKILGTMQDYVSYNVEDLGYFGEPIDFRGIAIAMQFALKGYRMVMEIVQQKDEPQKGGMYGFDPQLFDTLTSQKGRAVVIESFQLGLPPSKLTDGIENPEYHKALRNILWLNRNFNHYPFPLNKFNAVEDGGLPVRLEIKELKDGALRIFNATPQGDINLMLPTAYVTRDFPLQGLKVRKDIPLTLETMRQKDSQKGFRQFLSQFTTAGVVVPDHPFALITKLADKSPLTIGTILDHPWFTKRTKARHLHHLEALSEVFKVEGSLVYEARMQGDKVMLRVNPDSRRGSADKYNSRAGTEIEAQDIKSMVFEERRVWTGHKSEDNLSYILICNRQEDANEGELVFLLGKYNESVPNERKLFFLEKKFKRVVRYAREIEIDKPGIQKIKKAFQALSWQFLFENGATTIVSKLVKELELA